MCMYRPWLRCGVALCLSIVAGCGGRGEGVTAVVHHGAAVTVRSISPDTLRSGTPISIVGAGFSAALLDDSVFVDGVAASVVSASDSTLTAMAPSAFPCSLTDSGSVTVAVRAGGRTVVPHEIQSAALHPLAVGEAILLSAADASCAALPGAGATYAVNVYSASTNSFPQGAPFIIAATSSATPLAELTPSASLGIPSPPRMTPRTRPGWGPFNTENDVSMLDANAAYVRDHPSLLETLRAYHARARQRGRRAGRASVTVAPPVVGSFRQIALPIPSCVMPTLIQARVAAVSRRTVVYEDTSSGWGSRLDSVLANIGQVVDDEIYPSDSTNFSDPLLTDSLTDDDGRMAIVFSEQVNRAGNLGLISACDFSPAGTKGNFGEFVYSALLPSTFPNAAAVLFQQQLMVIAHEMKHLAAFEWRFTHQAPLESTWMEEGLAEHAEELWARNFVYRVPWKGNTGYQTSMYCDLHLADARCRGVQGLTEEVYQLYHFLDSTSVHSPLGATVAGDATSYNSSWSLIRWAIDRYATNESAALRGLVQSNNVGMTNLSAVTGHPAGELLGFWSLALLLDDAPAAAGNPDLNIATWNLYEILANVRQDGSATNPALAFFFGNIAPAPAVQAEADDFALSHAGLWGGGFLPLRVATAKSVLRVAIGVRGTLPGVQPPPELRLAIARIQ
jgi:hypothetical protein